MWTGPLACLSLSSVDVVDKDQVSQSGFWVSNVLVPQMKMKTQRVKMFYSDVVNVLIITVATV